MTSMDGTLRGEDADGVPYTSEYTWEYVNRMDDRMSIFYTALPYEQDMILINILQESKRRGKCDADLFERGGLSPLGIRHNYRSSKGIFYNTPICTMLTATHGLLALALGANGGIAYIAMSPENGRTIFSPASKTPRACEYKCFLNQGAI